MPQFVEDRKVEVWIMPAEVQTARLVFLRSIKFGTDHLQGDPE